MFETITKEGQLLAIIITHQFQEPGIHFFTPGELSQQLAYMHHPVCKEIPPPRPQPCAKGGSLHPGSSLHQAGQAVG